MAQSALINGLIFGWKKNQDYGCKLIDDLDEQQMTAQPANDAVNHPAWVLAHLNVYHPVIRSLIQGQSFEDPKGHEFGMQSKPLANRSVYPSKQELCDQWISGHQQITELLEAASTETMEQAMPLERWKAPMPTVGLALPYLMLVHENIHLGQLSAWRRVQSLPSV
jgi:hypothetical protein